MRNDFPSLNKPALPEKESDDSLENILVEKIETFSNLLGQIQIEIKARQHLSGQIIYKIYYQYCTVKSYFLQLYEQWEMGRNRSVELRRSRLEQQLNQLLAEKRMEQARCFKDISILQKESRQWFKQYRDLLQRVQIVLPNTIVKPRG